MPVYKDESKGTWYCKFYYVDWTGTRRQKMKRGFRLQRDAKDYERTFLEQFAKSPDISFKGMYNKFCSFKNGRIRNTTLQRLCYRIERNILPFFENMTLSQITPEDVARWQSVILEKGYSPTHCRQLTAFDILYFTGIRKGELLALTLGDIDFDHCTISITKTLKHTKNGIVINPPKTEKSERTIDIPSFLTDEIKLYTSKIYGMQKEDRLFNRAENWIHLAIKSNYEKAGVKRIRAHDIRHSHASLLIDLGANPLMIAERLGHEDIKMTMNVYAHLFESHKHDIMDKLENVKL